MLTKEVSAVRKSDQQATSRAVMNSSRGLLALLQLYYRASELEASAADESGEFSVSPLILRELLSVLQYRDENTFLHSRRVALIAVKLAQQLCWNPTAVRELELAAMLHDIGKIGIPDHILFKPGRLTVEEASLMDLRTSIAEDILEVCRIPQKIRNIIVESRLPYSGLEDYMRPVGRELSQAGRLLAVADVYESLTRDQVYRKSKTREEIVEILSERAGTRYDASMVKTLIRWLETGGEETLRQATADMAGKRMFDRNNASLAMTSLCNVFSYLYTLEQSYDGFVVVDPTRRILLASRGCRQIFQRADEDVTGQLLNAELFPMADLYQEWLADEETPLRRTLMTHEADTTEVKVACPDKGWAELEVQSIPLFDFDGELVGVTEFYRYKNRNRTHSAQYRELALQASRDALTGVANRGALESQLSRIMQSFKDDPNGNLFSVIYLDIDHFKSINDNFGHATGDEVLVTLARLLREETYSSEFVARYGGEEFVVICPELEADQAAKRAERFRLEISKLKFRSAPTLKITSSFGISQAEASDSLESVLKRADQALYKSKNEGRNRTTILRRSEVHEENPKHDEKENPYLFEADIVGMLFDDFLVMKLEGFVSENCAKIGRVSEGEVEIMLGRKGLFRKWGKSPDRQPVRVHVDASAVVNARGKLSNNQSLKVTVTPVGKPGSPAEFQQRARLAYRTLRYHFLSQG